MHLGRKFITGVFFGVLATQNVPVTAQDQDYAMEVMNELLINGFPDSEIKVLEIKQLSTYEAVDTAKAKKIVTPSKIISIQFFIPALGSNSNAAPAFQYIHNQFSQACISSGGKLSLESTKSDEKSKLNQIESIKRDLYRAHRYGYFECKSGNTINFGVNIDLPPNIESTGLSGWNWKSYISLIPKNEYLRLAEMASIKKETELKHLEDAKLFRSKMTVGQLVAIRAKSLPANVLPPASSRIHDDLKSSEGAYQVCGLVIDKRENIAQIQIGVNTLFVPLEDIFPFKKSRTGAFGEKMNEDWDNWCLKQ